MSRSLDMKTLAGILALTAVAGHAQGETPRVKVTSKRVGGRFVERLHTAQQKKATPPPAPAPVRRTYRRPARRVVARPRPAAPPRNWRFAYANVSNVSFSLARRAAGARGDRATGDLVLQAEPSSAQVFFYVNGGSQLPETTNAVVKGQKAPAKGNLYLLAVAPDLSARAGAFVPVKPGFITTVRFRFDGTAGATASAQ